MNIKFSPNLWGWWLTGSFFSLQGGLSSHLAMRGLATHSRTPPALSFVGVPDENGDSAVETVEN